MTSSTATPCCRATDGRHASALPSPRFIDPWRAQYQNAQNGGFTMLGLGDLLTQVQRKTRVVNVIFNNGMLVFTFLCGRKSVKGSRRNRRLTY